MPSNPLCIQPEDFFKITPPLTSSLLAHFNPYFKFISVKLPSYVSMINDMEIKSFIK